MVARYRHLGGIVDAKASATAEVKSEGWTDDPDLQTLQEDALCSDIYQQVEASATTTSTGIEHS